MQEPSSSFVTSPSAGHRARARSGIAAYASWQRSLDEVLGHVLEEGDTPPDLVVMFVARDYADSSKELVARAREQTRAGTLVGCFGNGCIGSGRELERIPGLSLLALWLPSTEIHAMHIDQPRLQALGSGDSAPILDDSVDAWVVLTEPYRLDVAQLVEFLARSSPGVPVVGGMASSEDRSHRTELFIDDAVYQDGAIAIGLRGGIEVLPIVSQACEPIGEPWTVTEVDRTSVLTISGRPAIDVMIETVAALDPDEQRRAKRHLLVGFAGNEYCDEFHRGDFLIRGVLGVDHERAAIIVGDRPRVGQTIQFQMRDPLVADIDLHQHLLETRAQLGKRRPIAGLMASCAGRGSGLFGKPDHDAAALQAAFGPLALAGFRSVGEIGPIGNRIGLHSYAASIGLIVER
jgi:small ligand-binding sensory domain FIST